MATEATPDSRDQLGSIELRVARYDDPEAEQLVSRIFGYYRELYHRRGGGGGGGRGGGGRGGGGGGVGEGGSNRTSVPEAYLPPEGLFLLAFEGGEPIGCGGFRRCEVGEAAAELKRMWVEPDHRGRGIARLMLEELERRAEAVGYRRMMLDTGPLQTRAIEIYEQAGYRRIPNYGRHAENEVLVSFAKDLDLGYRANAHSPNGC